MKQYVCLLLFIFTLQAKNPPDLFKVGMGAYAIPRDKWRTIEFDLEYQFGAGCLGSDFQFLELRPVIGVMMTAQRTWYVSLGLNFDLLFKDHLLVAPGFAAGYYGQGNGRNLGHPIEFRSGLEVAWQFSDFRRLGVYFYHLSNASISKRNPGEESLVLFYSIPITAKFPFVK